MRPTRTLLLAAGLSLLAAPAYAHVGVGDTSSFAAGFAHPLVGLDHLIVMIAVGAWAAMKGGRALWAWPVAFVGVMLIGGGLGMAGVAVPFVEPAILASVVALGLLVALAVDLPVWARRRDRRPVCALPWPRARFGGSRQRQRPRLCASGSRWQRSGFTSSASRSRPASVLASASPRARPARSPPWPGSGSSPA